MSSKYNQQPRVGSATRFSRSPMANVEFSRMVATPTWSLPFNAGDIVPVYYSEILPHSTFSLDSAFVLREMTKLRPVMGEMLVDIYAFWVPNRIINDSWKNVQGENTSGFWTAPEVELAPLCKLSSKNPTSKTRVQVPVGSLADYYGFPTQAEIPIEVLEQCNDLKFRGYLEIYNNYFRDQNYQPPIPYSKLNIYNGFFDPVGTVLRLDGGSISSGSDGMPANVEADGSFPNGAIVKAIAGDGGKFSFSGTNFIISSRVSTFSALGSPLKANKLHDYFTSVLPSPQKGAEVYFGVGDVANVDIVAGEELNPLGTVLRFANGETDTNVRPLALAGNIVKIGNTIETANDYTRPGINATNLEGIADLSNATGISVNDLRTAIATQQVYETLARGGSRYTSMLRNFFELETESPFMDIPLQLGHIRETLDLYQVAQTSATNEESPQGNLAAYGYTQKKGHLFTRTFIEHGYVHVFAVVRQKNVYSSYLAQDNFRRGTLDFYLPQFANIGEQPLRLALLNPFADDSMEKAIGYQEAWAEYRYEPDRVHGLFRSGVDGSLDVWTYADDFDPNFEVIDGNWLKSNAEEVLNRTIAVTSDFAPQFKGQFTWRVDKQLPMPTYSVPGLDNI